MNLTSYRWIWRFGVSLLVGLALSAWLRRGRGAGVENLPAAPPAGTDPGKVVGPVPQPVPTGSAISGAEKLLKEVHGPELSRTSPAEMDALAQTLIGEARQAENAGEQWVLLREAATAPPGPAMPCWPSAPPRQPRERFDLDPRALMGEVLERTRGNLQPTPEAAAVEVELARRCFAASRVRTGRQGDRRGQGDRAAVPQSNSAWNRSCSRRGPSKPRLRHTARPLPRCRN